MFDWDDFHSAQKNIALYNHVWPSRKYSPKSDKDIGPTPITEINRPHADILHLGSLLFRIADAHIMYFDGCLVLGCGMQKNQIISCHARTELRFKKIKIILFASFLKRTHYGEERRKKKGKNLRCHGLLVVAEGWTNPVS